MYANSLDGIKLLKLKNSLEREIRKYTKSGTPIFNQMKNMQSSNVFCLEKTLKWRQTLTKALIEK